MNLLARSLCGIALLGLGMACTSLVGSSVDQSQPALTEPRIIDPGAPGGPPSDAIVLFDGKDLSQWVGTGGGPAKWEVKDGVVTVNRTGSITTKQEFGDAQLHVEWATPAQVKGEGQERGNSGVFLQSRYEVQVLDSYQNKTYFNGQAGAVYKQYVPLVNACRKPGEWQTYDIIFHAAKYKDGQVEKPATVTVLHNGVLTHEKKEILGPSAHRTVAKESPYDGKGPIRLQDHGNAVWYRNLKIRAL